MWSLKIDEKSRCFLCKWSKKLCIIKRQWRSSICLWFLILFFFCLSGNKRQDLFYLFLSSLIVIKHQTTSARNTAPTTLASSKFQEWHFKAFGEHRVEEGKTFACFKEGMRPSELPTQFHWIGWHLSSWGCWNGRHRAVILLMSSQGSHTDLIGEI